VEELEARGHVAVAPDLGCDDVTRGGREYATTVIEALGGADPADVVVVGHSLGGATTPLVPAGRYVYLCALLPMPGRSLAEQFADDDPFVAGADDGRDRDDEGRSHWTDPAAAIRTLYGVCDPQLAADAASRLRPQAAKPMLDPCPLDVLPDAPTDSVIGAADRIISPQWSRAAAPKRLGVEPIELDSDHSPMLSCPAALADVLVARA
jgi:pimeloyl-ACP methyl ester carboxylesterase